MFPHFFEKGRTKINISVHFVAADYDFILENPEMLTGSSFVCKVLKLFGSDAGV